jgi:selenide,water dikinase
MNDQRLTLYSHAAGCGCKIAPNVLKDILSQLQPVQPDSRLLVGHQSSDDAAVLDLGDGTALISTTDFFMPIVDDAYTFGRIAAANALSDVYAMGGKPLLAIAVLGWPVSQLSPELAGQVMRGGQAVCTEAGIPLAGGHSVDALEPFFGLAVTGRVPILHLKRNTGAQIGDLLYLTKPLGSGILTTAAKLDRLKPEDDQLAINAMTRLNRVGESLGAFPWVHAMTDITGFGLLGHLLEMCQHDDIGAQIDPDQIPLLDKAAIDYYLRMLCIPGATNRNWDACLHAVSLQDDNHRAILCDPQTNGGLLVAIDPAAADAFEEIVLEVQGHRPWKIGSVTSKSDGCVIEVIDRA